MEFLVYRSAPFFFFAIIALGGIVLVEIGKAIGRKALGRSDERASAAFNVAQTAIFSLSALILAFSFSLAESRFDIRRNLVVDEANAIGTTYQRAGYLPANDRARFRSALTLYTRLRLEAYTYNPDLNARLRAERDSIRLQSRLWSIAGAAGRADNRNVQLALVTQSLNQTIDLSAAQAAALRIHLPDEVIALIIVLTFASAFSFGLIFGFARSRFIGASVVLPFILAFLVNTIIDLDRPQTGLIHVDLTPLQTQLQSMEKSATMRS